MGKLDCFAIEGLEVWFNSHDHFPPHFHASKAGKWEIRVWFMTSAETLDYEIARATKNERPSAKLNKKILKAIDENRAALQEEWEAKVLVQENLNE